MRNKLLVLTAAAIAVVGGMMPALADYPEEPVRVIVGFPPGGGTDTAARFLAQQLSERTGGTFVIENIPGANGSIGAAAAAAAEPDGYTLFYGNSGILLISPKLYDDAGYTLEDFTPVVRIAYIRNLVLAHESLGVSTIEELTELAENRPGELNFGSGGIGNASHLAGERLKRATSIDMLHIPYQGGAAAVTAFMGGDLDVLFPSVSESTPVIESGMAIPLAVMSAERVEAFPDVPTLTELGIVDADVASWHSFVAPAGTPDEVVQWLNAEINAVLESDEAKDAMGRFGLTIAGGSAEEFATELAKESNVMDELVAIVRESSE